MAFTNPTDDIILQEGVFAYDYEASGSIKAGQCLIPIGTFQAKVVGNDPSDAFIGVAAYAASDKDQIAVYGPGNIVRCIVSGTSKCTVGDDLMTAAEGKVSNAGAAAGKKIGVALQTQATADGTVKVLLT